MARNTDFYKSEIEKLDSWDKLSHFWQEIQNNSIDESIWAPGKAFEFFILRCFEIDGAEVTYPYEVEILNKVVEQIDGAIYYKGVNCLIESKDYTSAIDITPIAKLRSQLMRRPAATIGCVFVKSGFSPSAITLTKFMFPQTILLWNGLEVDYAVETKKFCDYLYLKFKQAVEHGVLDLDITLK
jgi:hypothetical protein